MKILHSADWHLGASLGPEKRFDEFDAVLKWLIGKIAEEQIEVVIIAGDVFDSGMPSNRASELYYRFLADARTSGVRSVIVVAGNHDSASFLEAPENILKFLAVTVVGRVDSDYDRQILPLRDRNGKLGAVVCAVPYLRDRDIRKAVSGEDIAGQMERRRLAIRDHYRAVCRRARELYPGTPLIATGHFYATGGTVSDGNTVGNLTNITVADLPETIDYLALGHLHTPQSVGGRENCRYAGSLLRMSFGDHDSDKAVLILDTDHLSDAPRSIPIPVFQRMEKISGTLEIIHRRLEELKEEKCSVWVHAENTGPFEPGLSQKLSSWCGKSAVRILSCRNLQENPVLLLRRRPGESGKLRDLAPEQVFSRLLAGRKLPQERQDALLNAFREAVRELSEEDRNGE